MLSLPLFPGYVFCRFDALNQSHVVATSGVIDVVRVGGQAAPVEASEIEAIVRVVNSPVPAEPYPTLASGEHVMLSGGPLSGLTGTLVEIRNGLRLVISVELLCRSVLVEIERDWVVPSRRSETNYRPPQPVSPTRKFSSVRPTRLSGPEAETVEPGNGVQPCKPFGISFCA